MTRPQGHGHPGAHGVAVDIERAAAGKRTIADIYLLMHCAIMTHPRMSGMPTVTYQVSELDDIAGRDARIRQECLDALGITPEAATNHEEMVLRLAGHLGITVQDARDFVEEDVRLYLEYRDFAKLEWSKIKGLTFDIHMIGIVTTARHNLVALANALSLSMPEMLVLVRSLVAIDAANRDRTKPKES